MSLKCDLNPVFRRKGALLWPPLHPSPHFHPPCLGRRTKALKRLSTSSLGPHLVGRSKSTFEPLTMSTSSPPSLSPVLLCAASYLPCCMSRPSTSCHHASRYLPPSASPSWRGQTTGIVWFCEKARPLPDCWVFGRRTCACDAAPARFFNAFFLCSSSLSSRWPGEHLVVQSLVVIKQPPFENTGKHVIVKCLFLELLNSYFSFSTLSSSFHAVSNKCLAMRHSEPPTACSHFLQ